MKQSSRDRLDDLEKGKNRSAQQQTERSAYVA